MRAEDGARRRPEVGHAGLLRVLVLFHESDALGAGLSVVRALDELRAYGWSPSGWFPRAGPLLELAEPALAAVEHGKRPIAVSWRGWREEPGVLARVRATPRYLAELRDALIRLRPHVVHANTLHALAEAAVARRAGLPVVLQCHELPPPSLKRELAVLAAGRVADVLVAVSNPVASLLRRYALGTPVHVVHNGIASAEVAAGTSADALVVGSIGTVSRVKGTDVFLRAAALALEQRPELRFEHVGSPDLHRDARLREELARLLAQERVRTAVRMHGEAPASGVLPRWGLYVSASRSEGFPLATLEAMAAGLPVIATAVGGTVEQIEHLVSGILVPPDDPAALAAWIVRLHDDPGLRRRLGAEGRRRVAQRFTLARQAEGLHRAYVTALNLRFGPPAVRREARSRG